MSETSVLEYNDIFYSNTCSNISGKVHITSLSLCMSQCPQDWIHVRMLRALCVSVIIVDRKYCLLKLITLAIK